MFFYILDYLFYNKKEILFITKNNKISNAKKLHGNFFLVKSITEFLKNISQLVKKSRYSSTSQIY